jgi:hypothetical protein
MLWYSSVNDPNMGVDYIYQYLIIPPGTAAKGIFKDTGSNHNYVRVRLYPGFEWYPAEEVYRCGNNIHIKYGSNTIASVVFGDPPACSLLSRNAKRLIENIRL